MKGQSFGKRLGFALHGLQLALRREMSFRTHFLAALAVLLTLCVTRPSVIWWAIVMLATGLVMVAELLNTAIETLVDHLHPEQHPEIGAVKDIAAGGVLVASLIALLVAGAFLLSLLNA